jgi:hypothetical protein
MKLNEVKEVKARLNPRQLKDEMRKAKENLAEENMKQENKIQG